MIWETFRNCSAGTHAVNMYKYKKIINFSKFNPNGEKKEKKGKIDTFQLKERQAARPHKLPQSSSQLLSPLLVMLPHHSVECNMMQNLDNVTYD